MGTRNGPGVCLLAALAAACSGKDGKDGRDGASGPPPAVTVGGGLTGTGEAASPLSVSFGGTGAAASVARSDHDHVEIGALQSAVSANAADISTNAAAIGSNTAAIGSPYTRVGTLESSVVTTSTLQADVTSNIAAGRLPYSTGSQLKASTVAYDEASGGVGIGGAVANTGLFQVGKGYTYNWAYRTAGTPYPACSCDLSGAEFDCSAIGGGSGSTFYSATSQGSACIDTGPGGVDVYATASTPFFTVATNGNVGIGTASPSTGLDVAGAMRPGYFAGGNCDSTKEGAFRRVSYGLHETCRLRGDSWTYEWTGPGINAKEVTLKNWAGVTGTNSNDLLISSACLGLYSLSTTTWILYASALMTTTDVADAVGIGFYDYSINFGSSAAANTVPGVYQTLSTQAYYRGSSTVCVKLFRNGGSTLRAGAAGAFIPSVVFRAIPLD
jgi:hypothetical protein